MIEGLPRNSLYIEAVSLNRELAAQLLDDPPPDDSHAGAIRMRDFSPEVEQLMGVRDMVGQNVTAVVAVSGQKPPKIRPAKRPRTASDDLRSERRAVAHRALAARVLSKN